MMRIWKYLYWGFGLLMFAFVFGFGPAIFPAYQAGPKYEVSDAGKRLAQTQAKLAIAPTRAIEPPPKTWRNWMHDVFMLSPVKLNNTRSVDRSELESLRRRSAGQSTKGHMAVSRGH